MDCTSGSGPVRLLGVNYWSLGASLVPLLEVGLKSATWSLRCWDLTGSSGRSIPELKLELDYSLGDKPEEQGK